MDLKATGRPLGLGHTCCRHLSRKPSRTFPPPTFQKPEQVKRPDGTTDRPRGVAAPVLPSLPWWLALQSQTPPHAACGAPRHHARPDVGRRCTADARSSAPARGGENGEPARVSVPFLPFKNTAKKKLAGYATEPNGSARGHGRGVAPEKHEQSRPDVSRLQEHHQSRRRKCGGGKGKRARRMRLAAVARTTRMAAEEMRRASASAAVAATTEAAPAPAQAGSRWARVWPSALRWIPTSTDRIIAAEKRLLSIVKYDLAPSSNFSKVAAEYCVDLVLQAFSFRWCGTAS